ncbi:SAM-dependent methyltransferase [Pseudohongiella spirulinae]|uniref:Cyclopropane-fatty-acyl-phospholipid synthase n=1 Tax=Pseudohongiella spirulinae TaxID=1249552 RepID=A0A0S2KAF2_9GAMM|nr:cyclopropane-fatty-acyl-phospholipid synthase family protein [Pseudohongiella spirulinae]ALO45054.1 cyclopropane-fatty-acyl-phospholipid synthase [Pseudohongiella spirulinae]
MKSPGNYQAGLVQAGVLESDSISRGLMDKATARQRLARELLHRRLNLISKGTLIIDEGDQLLRFGEQTPDSLTAHVIVTDPDFYQAVAYNGSIGGGESYMRHQWHTPDLVALVRIMVLNLPVLQGMDGGKSWVARMLNKVLHLRNRNTISGSKANIAAHYDLSNQFFETFLDPSMMYSAAIFEHEKQSLHEASLNKLTHICERLQLKPDDHLLEIGTGWGSMAIHAARHYGCRVTSATISQEQYEYACKRVAEEGLQDRIEILLEDYRNLQGQYDKLVSIEMIEAVGHQYFSTYFAKCSSLLKSDGLMLIQAITISDQRYENSLHSVDFIQRYIFPGGCLPSNTAIANHICKDTDLQIVGLEDITRDYALTLERWRTTFLSKVRNIQEQGFGPDFIRMWDYYLAYCQGGFMERVIHTAQFLMAKPDCRLQPLHARIPAKR